MEGENRPKKLSSDLHMCYMHPYKNTLTIINKNMFNPGTVVHAFH